MTGDIKSLFFQLQVLEQDQNALRFLWWKNGNVNEEVEEYKMLVHTFGLTSSPSCSWFALKETTKKNETNASPAAVKTIDRNLYVDDWLRLCDTTHEAKQLVSEVTKLLASGGFQLTKFCSSSRDVLNSIPEEDRAPGVKTLQLELFPEQKTLGYIGVLLKMSS